MRSYTLHVPFLADDDGHAVRRGEQMVRWLRDENAGDDEMFGVGAADWDVSDTVDWAEIVDRVVT